MQDNSSDLALRPKRKPLETRLQQAEDRVDNARRHAQLAQARVNALKREISKSERRRRTHQLIRMGGMVVAIGIADPEELEKFLVQLRSWTFTDAASGEKRIIVDHVLKKIQAARSST